MTFLAPRFWVPYGKEIPLMEDGFMPDPGTRWWGGSSADFQSLEALSGTPCLILIGDPGLGKTTSLRAEYERMRARKEETDDHAHWVSLGSTRQEDVLERRIFDSAAYETWIEGEGRLHLFLDALDEARLRIARVADLLLEGLADAPFDRLALRLSCRSANRHLRLEGELKQRFGEKMFQVRELAPLLRRDVRDVAAARGLPAEDIVARVINRGLQPLAMIPETLRFLLDVAEGEGDVPSDRTDAFERGLLLLASEPDEDRRTGETAGRLSASARLALAARVAAALVLTGRTTVRIDQRAPGPDEAALVQVAGGHELDRTLAVAGKVEASADALSEALSTAVFSGHGEAGRVFAQESYAEFLCARWVAGGSLTADQLDDLLFMDTGGRLRVVPQLNEVATWLANQSNDFFARLLDRDPTVLLRSDPVGLDAAGRRRLVDALISGVSSFEVDRWDRRMRGSYPRLAHPGLADQLREVIFDTGAESRTRQVACDVAGACELTALEHELASLALDSSADLQVRLASVTALNRYASSEVRRRLRPLALKLLVEDADDELKGAALSAVWPRELKPSELFAALTPPKRTNLYGLYQSFLRNEVVDGLKVRDLPVALRWAATLPVDHLPTHALDGVREQLLIRAWPTVENTRITPSYADLVATLLRGHEDLLSREALEDHPEVFREDAGRRRLIARLVRQMRADEIHVSAVVFSTPPLISGLDTPWVLQQLADAIGAPAEKGWALLAEALLAVGADDDLIMAARERSAELKQLTAYRYEPIRLGSEEAERARERHEKWQRIRHDREEEPLDLDIPGKVSGALDRVDAGDLDGFWLATKWLEIDPARRQREMFVSDISALPGWEFISEADRDRLRTSALTYLCHAPLETAGWFGRNKVNWPAWAGYRALRLLRDQCPDVLNDLDDEVWARWVPIIVHWPRNDAGEGGEGAFSDWAIERVARRVPKTTAKWFGLRLDGDLRGGGHPFTLHRFRQVWNDSIEAVLLQRARRTRLAPEQRTELLEVLVRNRSQTGVQHAQRLVTAAAVRAGGQRRELAVRVAGLLAAEGPEADWDRIWPLMLADEAFGIDLVEHLASARERDIASRLSERQAGALYEWVMERFSYDTDPDDPEAHFVSTREQVGRWRDGVLRTLVGRATREGVRELGRLAAAHPDLSFLRRMRRQAEESVQRSEWTPPTPASIVSMADDAARRHVRSASDLRRVIISSLERAQTKLQGLTPAVHDLWDAGTVRPKPERHVAAWVERHLKEDLAGRGIVLGREVELRPHPKGKMGEAVDILVTALAGPEVEGAPQVAVSLELKCCWNADLDSGMQDQLVDRYLDDELTQGIYAVAYFDATEWDDSDSRNRQRCRRRDLEASRQFFADQATSVSSEQVADVSSAVLDCSLPVSRAR